MKYPHVLDSAKHFSVCLHFPSKSPFLINSLRDTKKGEVSLKPDLELQNSYPSVSGTDGACLLLLD